MKKLLVISAVVLSLAATSCRTRAVVTTRPEIPSTAVVVRPAAPHADYVWIDGEWVWSGGGYVYRNGYWAAPRRGHVWIAGNWEHRGNGWYWRRGYWK